MIDRERVFLSLERTCKWVAHEPSSQRKFIEQNDEVDTMWVKTMIKKIINIAT